MRHWLPAGAAVAAVGEDAHHGCRPDPRSGLQGAGGTLSQRRHQTDHQQTAALHQQPHPAGQHQKHVSTVITEVVLIMLNIATAVRLQQRDKYYYELIICIFSFPNKEQLHSFTRF